MTVVNIVAAHRRSATACSLADMLPMSLRSSWVFLPRSLRTRLVIATRLRMPVGSVAFEFAIATPNVLARRLSPRYPPGGGELLYTLYRALTNAPGH